MYWRKIYGKVISHRLSGFKEIGVERSWVACNPGAITKTFEFVFSESILPYLHVQPYFHLVAWKRGIIANPFKVLQEGTK